MHSSRMRTARLIHCSRGVYLVRWVYWSWGVYLVRGVYLVWGVYMISGWGCTWSRGSVPAQILPPVDRILDTRF